MKEEQLLKQKFGSQRPFKVPEGYFDSLEKSLMQNVVEPAVPNKRPAIKAFMRPLKWAACFAAVLLVSGTIYFNSLEKNLIRITQTIYQKICHLQFMLIIF